MKEGLKVTINDLLTWLDKMSGQNVCGQNIMVTKCLRTIYCGDKMSWVRVRVTFCPCDMLSLWYFVPVTFSPSTPFDLCTLGQHNLYKVPEFNGYFSWTPSWKWMLQPIRIRFGRSIWCRSRALLTWVHFWLDFWFLEWPGLLLVDLKYPRLIPLE